jgi:hypothetical protein
MAEQVSVTQGRTGNRSQLVGRPAMPLRVPMDGPWSASVLLVEREGTIVTGGLVVAPSYRRGRVGDVPSSGLTVRDLRSIRLSEAFRDSYALYLGFPGAVQRTPTEDELVALAGIVPEAIDAKSEENLDRLYEESARIRRSFERFIATATTKRPPRRGQHLTDDDYAQIALLYLRALRRQPLSPLKWMVANYRKRGRRVSRDKLRDRVHTARERGFLTDSRPGFPGGQPTKKLLDWQLQRTRKRKGGS